MKEKRLIKIDDSIWIETKSKRSDKQLRQEFKDKHGSDENNFSPEKSNLSIFHQKRKLKKSQKS
jgi:hypothetical protein